ncbi:hypothetical protein ACNOYE_08360 [Nannocystaceae bacterium ST9]
MTELALGIDVASGAWIDNGAALIEFDRAAARFVRVQPGAIEWPRTTLTAPALADAIDEFVRRHGVKAVALDGPQGWRDPATPVGARGVGRRSDLAARTQGKIGVYPRTYPRTQRGWIEFCIELFDHLLGKPDVALANSPDTGSPSGYVVLECFPTSTWRASGITPLPGKARKPTLEPWVSALSTAYELPSFTTGSHDDLQAVVASLAAVALAGGPARPLERGVAAWVADAGDGVARRLEGIIWDAQPLAGPALVELASSSASSRSSQREASPNTASVSVTQRILDKPGAMAIALRGTPGGTREAPIRLALVIEDETYELIVGDTSMAWAVHQDDDTRESFESLFARLADEPDTRITIEDLRELGPATLASRTRRTPP